MCDKSNYEKIIKKYLYDQKGIEKIRNEAEILSEMNHKNIVQFMHVL